MCPGPSKPGQHFREWDKLLKSRRGCLEKLHPGESLKPRDFPKANARAQREGLPSENPEAFRLSRGRSFSDNPKAFQQFVRLWFPRGAGTDLPKCVVWKNFKKAAVKSVHCKSQTAPIGNQSLLRSVLVKQANPRLRRCPNTSIP